MYVLQAHGLQMHQLLVQLNAQADLQKELHTQCASQQQLLAKQAAREAATHQAHLNALQMTVLFSPFVHHWCFLLV